MSCVWVQVFEFYAVKNHSNNTHMNESMDFKELLMFASDFQLCPGVASKADLQRIFKACNTSEATGDEHAQEFCYGEFLEALGRLALQVFAGPVYQASHPTAPAKVMPLLVPCTRCCLHVSLEHTTHTCCRWCCTMVVWVCVSMRKGEMG